MNSPACTLKAATLPDLVAKSLLLGRTLALALLVATTLAGVATAQPDLTATATAEPPEPALLHHELEVYLDPFNAYLEVTDQLSFPDASDRTARDRKSVV